MTIDFSRSVRSIYGQHFVSLDINNAEKYLLVVAAVTNGIIGDPVRAGLVQKAWLKQLFKVAYHYRHSVEAETVGWVDRTRQGYVSVTKDGIRHLESFFGDMTGRPLDDKTELIVFSAKQTHDFDSLLRSILFAATSRVRIADSYVDETIFDTLLASIPKSTRVELMFNHDSGTEFHERVKRFKIQYPDFHYARYPKLHDRYIVVDTIGFVVGPSLKDAPVNAPAIIVRIGSEQSLKLVQLFDNTFKNLTKIT